MSLNTEENQAKAKVAQIANRRVKALSPDSDWTILQQVAQEIEASYKAMAEPRPSAEELKKLLKEEITNRYKDDPETQKILVEGIPSRISVHAWRKKAGWEDQVWEHIRTDNLFTPEKRATVIKALYTKATSDRPDTTAAKLWLTLSGDYSEKIDLSGGDVMEQFREINKRLHAKKPA